MHADVTSTQKCETDSQVGFAQVVSMTGSGSWALWIYMTMAQVYKAIITGLCFTSVFICISNSAPNAKKVSLRLRSNPYVERTLCCATLDRACMKAGAAGYANYMIAVVWCIHAFKEVLQQTKLHSICTQNKLSLNVPYLRATLQCIQTRLCVPVVAALLEKAIKSIA